MNLSDQLLGAMSLYGLPVLFGVLLIGSIGVPMPATLLLIAAGSFVEQGDLNLWSVLGLASAAAILGDNIGYALGRWGGRRAARRMTAWIGGETKLRQAKTWSKRWGGTGIFFSRWLVTPLGPWLNLTSGMTNYPWRRFVFFDVLGETLWVVLYVSLGRIFSDRVQAMSVFLGDVTWVIIGLIIAAFLSWRLFKHFGASQTNETLPQAERSTELS